MSLQNVRLKIYKADSSCVITGGFEIWPVTPRREESLRVFENRMIMRLFCTKKYGVTGDYKTANGIVVVNSNCYHSHALQNV